MTRTMNLLAALVAASFGSAAQAAVSADEAKALGTSLTAIGAEKAANKDGTIPAYTGGMTTRAGRPTRPATASVRTRSQARSRASWSTPRTWRSTPTS